MDSNPRIFSINQPFSIDLRCRHCKITGSMRHLLADHIAEVELVLTPQPGLMAEWNAIFQSGEGYQQETKQVKEIA